MNNGLFYREVGARGLEPPNLREASRRDTDVNNISL